jgi:hypothetical protein
MLALLSRILLALRSAFEVRAARQAEILVLRQQSLVLSRLVTPRDSSKPEARVKSADQVLRKDSWPPSAINDST